MRAIDIITAFTNRVPETRPMTMGVCDCCSRHTMVGPHAKGKKMFCHECYVCAGQAPAGTTMTNLPDNDLVISSAECRCNPATPATGGNRMVGFDVVVTSNGTVHVYRKLNKKDGTSLYSVNVGDTTPIPGTYHICVSKSTKEQIFKDSLDNMFGDCYVVLAFTKGGMEKVMRNLSVSTSDCFVYNHEKQHTEVDLITSGSIISDLTATGFTCSNKNTLWAALVEISRNGYREDDKKCIAYRKLLAKHPALVGLTCMSPLHDAIHLAF